MGEAVSRPEEGIDPGGDRGLREAEEETRIEREAMGRIVGRRILALRDQRRVEGPGHRVELQLSGRAPDFVRIVSGTAIALEAIDSQDDVARAGGAGVGGGGVRQRL